MNIMVDIIPLSVFLFSSQAMAFDQSKIVAKGAGPVTLSEET